ncbi:MAG: HlyD family efflux transporter periplasmic adaptor subunit [Acidobacteriota bacterium]
MTLLAGCSRSEPAPPARASGYVEATDVRVSSKVPGRVDQVKVAEGARVTAGDVLVVLSPVDLDLAVRHAEADRAQASAQLALVRAGARPEDVQQAQSQVDAAAADVRGAEAELGAAKSDQVRFEQLLQNRAGSQKQRDDAVTRREAAEARLKGATDRVHVADAALARIRAGARREEVDAARARVASADAQIATLNQRRTDATITSPASGIVSTRLAEPGEMVAVGQPLLTLVDLDHAWVNAYVEEPRVPSLRIDQAVTVVTDAGNRLPGRIAFISPKAEFTPRNVQTTAERAKLVYRVKVTVDNREGVLKPGMPAEVELGIP